MVTTYLEILENLEKLGNKKMNRDWEMLKIKKKNWEDHRNARENFVFLIYCCHCCGQKMR